ncbi:LysM peptidoglycan-binding domain-containing protein [Snodgrassella sp. B3088]|uniref:lytic transglycosylase n=1 Tax=Snodgrassella sp. B3088 TaxID=2818038 RepID=UPI00226A51DB|nr:LysM peptidoglycan-binding domain-containing protein [Snodgrassella sp. B3088]MCX8748152.1 LysM peptidoglycan-binding domain-containing protein [Snodgrassella sp. B3088]
MAQLKHMVLALTSLVLAPTISFAQSYTSNGIGLSIMNLNAATLKGKAYSTRDIWGRMRQDFRMTEVNPEIIRRQEQYYSSHGDYFNRTILRSQPYLYHIVNEAEKRQMPAEVALLPFIESAFVSKAQSRVGASGLWQFMPNSGRQYGLEQTNLYDGRHDVYAATDAALNYLQYLYSLFGDWSLALAAYNWGEGNVGKAIKRAQLAGIDPTYENLRMPNETRNYVPKLLAVRNIIENPQAFGINLVSVPNRPYFEAISIDQPIDIDAAARLANISTSEFLTLNPSFKSPVFIPKENRKMLLPITAVNTFERNYRKADKSSLLSWNIYKAFAPTSVADLAAQTGMSSAEIKRLNNLSSNTVPAGRSLLISKNSFSNQNLDSFSNTDTDPLLNIAMAQPVLPPGTFVTHPVVSVSQTSEVANTDNQQAPVLTRTTTVITTALNTAQPLPDNTTVQTVAVATSQPAANSVAPVVAENNDALMQIAQNAELQAAAAASVQKTLAQAEREEAQAARSAEIRAERATRNTINVADSRSSIAHKVNKGDTLFSIAQRYNINVADLVTANNLRGHNLQIGQVLKISPNSDNKRMLAAVGKGKETKGSIVPVSYTVKKGDTLSSIAQRLNIPVSKLQKVHGKQVLRPGQKIKLTNL